MRANGPASALSDSVFTVGVSAISPAKHGGNGPTADEPHLLSEEIV